MGRTPSFRRLPVSAGPQPPAATGPRVTPMPPYQRGDRLSVHSAEGIPLLVEVERVASRPDGGSTLVAAIKRPRALRGDVFVATTRASGEIRPAGRYAP